MALDTEGKQYTNEHSKFNQVDKYKAKKADVMQLADISKKDIATGKRQKKALKMYSLSELKELGLVNPTLTEDELKMLKEGKVKEPTGKFAE
tara:strand:+ start:295 stop:570 length:276 start_codon:yes stop_codon:yes gene_type:complete